MWGEKREVIEKNNNWGRQKKLGRWRWKRGGGKI
jgi:hypothetical protein